MGSYHIYDSLVNVKLSGNIAKAKSNMIFLEQIFLYIFTVLLLSNTDFY
jgi:hypothetical protein